jgi:ParB family transcriptional regulator, chromosome partitioning protein
MSADRTNDPARTAGKKRGLGRGLDALIAPRPPAPEPPPASPSPAASPTTLPLAALRPNRLQPRTRFDEESLADLAESIRAQGIVQPIVVTAEEGGTYSIVAGERRFRAAQLAGLSEVPVVLREVAGDRERLELALVENLQRSDLGPIEEAEAYKALQESFGLSQGEVAARVGRSQPAVANALRLLRLPQEVRDLLRDGRLTAGQARPLLAVEPDAFQIQLAQRAVAEGLSARDMERLAAPRPSRKPDKAAKPVEVHAAAAAETLTRKLQTRVEIRRRGKGGVLALHFHSEEELMRLYDLLIER